SDNYNGVSPFNDPSIFGNKDWDHGTNDGIEIAIFTGGTYKVNFTPQTVSRYDVVSSGPQLMSRWNHIAVSVQRMGYIRLYTNGILTDSLDIHSSHGKSIDGSYPYNFCDDGTGAYAHPLSAYVDEFRVWKGARTTDQIRKYMCRTVPAGAANLMVYYPMQQTTGTTVTDASGSGHNGTLTHLTSSAWVTSNAAVGDSSSYAYNSSWTGVSVSVNSPGSGMFSTNNISSSQTGIQVYRTNYPPVSTSGISHPGTDSVYFGVYPVNETSTYQVAYDYSSYPAGVTYETWSNLYNRVSVSTPWAMLSATKNTASNTFQSGNMSAYRHFTLGNLANTTYVQTVTEGNHTVSVFPNPATSGMVNFVSATGSTMVVSLFNLQGALVSSEMVTTWPYALSVGQLPAGTYIATCSNNTTNETFKLQIVK
ncbi:MAG: T9SS C-terminal target domain-containing protein, partial [Chitinophagia bacterium]|nr:T9SS C-terminal target domain-containing protein [Chitinophagia bacterium]